MKGENKMTPDLVYLMQDPEALRFSPNAANQFGRDKLPFSKLASQVEIAIAREYFLSELEVTHALLDTKFQIIEFFQTRRYPPSGDLDFCYIQPSSASFNPTIRRYRTIVLHNEATMGNVLGYSLRSNRKERLGKMVRAYVSRGEYARQNRFNPPFFALTSEPIDEVKQAFEEVGLEVKTVSGK